MQHHSEAAVSALFSLKVQEAPDAASNIIVTKLLIHVMLRSCFVKHMQEM